MEIEKHIVPALHMEMVRDRVLEYNPVNEREDAANIFHQMLDKSPIEKMAVIYCNMDRTMVGAEIVSMGTIESVATAPSELFRGAIVLNAPYVWIAHNHVDGLVKASQPDYRFTMGAITSGLILGITIIDHLVMGGQGRGYFSIKEHQREMIDAVRDYELKAILAGKKLPPLLPIPNRW